MAKRSRPAPATAIALSSSAWRSRATTWVETGSRARPRRAEDPLLEVGRGGGVGAHGARHRADGHLREGALQAAEVAVGLEGEAGQLDPERRRLGVDAVRAPDAQRVDVRPRLVGEGLDEGPGVGEHDLGHGAQLQGQAGVEDVAGGQAVVNPAPGRTGRGGEDVDEGGHIVVGDALALVDRLHREGGGADRVQLGLGGALQLLAGGHLDPAQGLKAGVVRPDLAELGAGVAGDHPRRLCVRRRCGGQLVASWTDLTISMTRAMTM